MRFASLKYHGGKWHPSSTITFEYKRWNHPNDPSMAVPSLSHPIVIEDSQSDEWEFDEETAEALKALIATDLTSAPQLPEAELSNPPVDTTIGPPPPVSAPPQPATQLPMTIVCPPRASALRVRKFRFDFIGTLPWSATKFDRRRN
jgi:hypothetical protein